MGAATITIIITTNTTVEVEEMKNVDANVCFSKLFYAFFKTQKWNTYFTLKNYFFYSNDLTVF